MSKKIQILLLASSSFLFASLSYASSVCYQNCQKSEDKCKGAGQTNCEETFRICVDNNCK